MISGRGRPQENRILRFLKIRTKIAFYPNRKFFSQKLIGWNVELDEEKKNFDVMGTLRDHANMYSHPPWEGLAFKVDCAHAYIAGHTEELVLRVTTLLVAFSKRVRFFLTIFLVVFFFLSIFFYVISLIVRSIALILLNFYKINGFKILWKVNFFGKTESTKKEKNCTNFLNVTSSLVYLS